MVLLFPYIAYPDWLLYPQHMGQISPGERISVEIV